jgi:hypothetical protein
VKSAEDGSVNDDRLSYGTEERMNSRAMSGEEDAMVVALHRALD